MSTRDINKSGRSRNDAERLANVHSPLKLVSRKHTGSIIAGGIVIYLTLSMLWIIATQPQFEWETVASYMFNQNVLNGLWLTLYLTVIICVFGLLGGLVIAVMMSSRNRVVSSIGHTYVWLVRGVPALVQIIFWYNMSSLFPALNFGIPPFGPTFFSLDPNTVMTPVVAAAVALSICDSAYAAEILRGGIMSVGRGQREAAAALGVSGRITMMRIILPQAMRAILPAIGNQVIGNLKFTSLASIIGTMELLTTVQKIYALNYKVIPLLLTASIWYIILTTILTLIQRKIEQRFGRGFGTETVKARAGIISTMTGRIATLSGRSPMRRTAKLQGRLAR